MGLGSGRSRCSGEGVSGAPTAVGGRLQPDSSLSPTLISDSTCGGELIGSPITTMMLTLSLCYRAIFIMCCICSRPKACKCS